MLNYWLVCVAFPCQYHNLVSRLMDGEALKSRYCIPSSTIDHCGRRAPRTFMHVLACVCLCLYLSRAAVNLGCTVGRHSICLMLPVAKQHIQQHWWRDACGNVGVELKWVSGWMRLICVTWNIQLGQILQVASRNKRKKRHIRGKKTVSPIGRVLFPGVEARGLRKLQSLLSSWLPKKTEEVCDNLEDGESSGERYKTTINQKINDLRMQLELLCPLWFKAVLSRLFHSIAQYKTNHNFPPRWIISV